MAKGLEWTTKQQEVAGFLREGLDRQAIMGKGYSKTMVSRVATALKTELKQAETKGKPEPGGGESSTKGETIIRNRQVDAVVVGEFIIEPEDWRLNQYGGFLVLNTFEYAKQEFGYNGTVGDFICDITQIFRAIMGLAIQSTEYLLKPQPKEDTNGGTETDQGAVVPAASRKSVDGG